MAPAIDISFGACVRIELDERCWVDHAPGWLQGSSEVMAQLLAELAWSQHEVVMYDRQLPEPRLTSWWSAGRSDGVEPHPVLGDARAVLGERYARHFDSIGFNLYRDGRDSVAWHRDRVRDRTTAVIAILSVGEPRPFVMRPCGGRATQRWALGDGDLLVMGGECQLSWEHAVPKSSHVRGPRLSITFRHGPLGWRPNVVRRSAMLVG